jgi:lactate dehydrogenase-like 2-hydroxyacid dehydrogenase
MFYPYMEYMAGDAAQHFDLFRMWEEKDVERAIDEKGGTVVAILTMGQDYPINDALFDRLPNLRLIVAVGAGYACVDVPQARARGIMSTNAGDTHSADCADHAIALAMALNRKIMDYDRYVRDGAWAEKGFPQHSRAFSAERVGILGLGRIGQAIAGRLVPFGVEIAWWGPNAKPVPWKRMDTPRELAEWSSMLMIAARGDAVGLVDRAMIEAVGPDGYIVNISRGGVVDEDALIEALREGRLAGAGLDVFREEPATPERWRDVPNVILSPHMAGQTVEAMARLREAAAYNLKTVLNGSPVVNELMS